MARTVERLTARKVETTKQAGMYADGGGLYLQVTKNGAKSWIYRYMLNGRAREMGLGAVRDVPLARAREKAAECRRLRAEGSDPIEARKERRAEARLETAKSITFDECAAQYMDAHSAGWRNAKHHAQWRNTLDQYAKPLFGSLPVQAIDTDLVIKVLKPIWPEKTETASRVRGRIEKVLDLATVRGYRRGENPARWRGHLENLLPKRSKVRSVKHHPALPYAELGAFMAELGEEKGIAARALAFAIYTAARSGEVIGARWDEIDLDTKIWTVPGKRMKAGKQHRVPLSEPALAILNTMRQQRDGDYVFPGSKRGRPLSAAMLKVLKRMKRDDVTVHGFRSTFRDWAADTNYPREVVEMALAHTIGNKVEKAYWRGDLFEKRRLLMQEWARFCGIVRPGGEVVPLKATA
jgi:integrase